LRIKVSAVKADKAKTLDLINKGEGGFLDRDLYPFCFNLGKNVAVAKSNRSTPQKMEELFGKERQHIEQLGIFTKTGCEGELCHQGGRFRLRRRLLQIGHLGSHT
jgi:hypothetical protein